MRCPDCNKFVSFDSDADPEVDVRVEDDGSVSGSVRITNNCQECGQELTEANLDIDDAVDADELKAHRKTCKKPLDVSLEASRSDWFQTHDRHGKPIKNPRYRKHYYGAEGDIVVTCACGHTFEAIAWVDSTTGGGMESLV